MVRNNEKRKPGSPEGTPASQETRRPMAVREITIEDRIEALTLRVEALEQQIGRHERYHFGKRE